MTFQEFCFSFAQSLMIQLFDMQGLLVVLAVVVIAVAAVMHGPNAVKAMGGATGEVG
jgi:hypothetical protein